MSYHHTILSKLREKHFETGFDNFGPDEIYLSNDVFFDCIEWLDVQVINQYESKIIDNAYSYALLEVKSSGKFKDENLTFKNLACQLFKWSHDHLLVFDHCKHHRLLYSHQRQV